MPWRAAPRACWSQCSTGGDSVCRSGGLVTVGLALHVALDPDGFGSGVDVLLVGDSLGRVLQGHPSTVPVTVEQMVYHTECVGHVTDDATAAGALRSGIAIAKSMIMDRVQWGPGQLSRDGHASGPS